MRTIARLFVLLITMPPISGCVASPSGSAGAPVFRVLFVGDTSFGESYQARLAEQGEANILETEGYDHSPRKLRPLLRRADVVIANLETPVTDRTDSPLAGSKTYLHWADVIETPAALARHGIGVVSLANNHTMDFGIEGLRDTLATLDRAGIRHFGAGPNDAAAGTAHVMTATTAGGTLEIVVAAGFEHRSTNDDDYRFYADETRGGVNEWSLSNAARQVQSLRLAHPDALLIAFPHWGRNYEWKIDRQVRLAHTLIDAGADLVIGHGAHALQEIERHRGGWILYGLGNFVFNSPGRYEREDHPPFSLAALLEVGGGAGAPRLLMRLYPILSDNRVTNYQPRFATAVEFERIRALLSDRTPAPGDEAAPWTTATDAIGPHLVMELSSLVNTGGE